MNCGTVEVTIFAQTFWLSKTFKTLRGKGALLKFLHFVNCPAA